MLRILLSVLILSFSASAVAQNNGPATEFGIMTGFQRSSNDDNTVTRISLPAGTAGSYLPAFYVAVMPNENVSIGSEFGLGYFSADDFSVTRYTIGGQVSYIFGEQGYGPYLSGIGTLTGWSFEDESDRDLGVGGGLGMMFRLGETNMVGKIEARYRRYFDDSINQISLLIGFGGRF